MLSISTGMAQSSELEGATRRAQMGQITPEASSQVGNRGRNIWHEHLKNHPGIQQALESPRRVSASLCWMPLDHTWLKDTLNYHLSEQADSKERLQLQACSFAFPQAPTPTECRRQDMAPDGPP